MAQAVPQSKPIFNDELVKKFDKDIKYLIKTQVFKYDSSDVCYEYDDVYQECLMHLWNATKIYDATRGMKFRSFAIFHLKSRLGNFRNKVLRKNKNETYSMSEIDGGWGICGIESNLNDNYSESVVSSQYSSFVADISGGQDALNEVLDAKRVLSGFETMIKKHRSAIKLRIKKDLHKHIDNKKEREQLLWFFKHKNKEIQQIESKQLLFSEYYIKGKKIKEICKESPNLKYHQARRHMKYLDQIYKTLIKGETPCLN